MKCDEARSLAALAASDDVTEGERAGLREHLAVCASCRAEADAFAGIMSSLAELREDPVPPEAYVAVRTRVMEQLTRRRRWWLWPAAAALAGACAVWIALLSVPAPIAPVPVAPVIEARIAPAVIPIPAPVYHRRKKRAPKQPEPAAEPLVVKMFTDDPQVVMYWIVGGRESNR